VAALQGNSDINTFQAEYSNFMGDNTCNQIANYNSAAQNDLTQEPNFGIQVMNQYID